MSTAFDMRLMHWPTVAEFAAYLQAFARPPWCQGITNHNTFHPNELEWRGVASMTSMRSTYIAKGWTSGPNLFCVATCPNPADKGIWQMTPITHPGTHAGTCNRDHLGVEHCGDFNARPPSEAQYNLLLAVNHALLNRWGLLPTDVNVHNECMPGRTCPGQYLTGEQIRADLAKPMTKAYRARRIMVSQRQEGGAPYWGELAPGEEVIVDKWYTNGYTHLQDGRGFVLLADLEAL